MGDESATQRLTFAWLLAAAFAIATVPRLLLHELWRDEAWLWLVVGDSNSLMDLWSRLGRTGQGYLFPSLCFLTHKVSSSWHAMQAVNLLLASASAFVFARWAPLERTARALFVFGYLPFYEYAVLSRHYAAGMLLVWLACVAAGSRRPALGLGLTLGLLCQTTVYGYILAVAVAAGWLVDRRLRPAERPPIGLTAGLGGLALGLGGALAGLVQLIPESGTSFAPGWRFAWEAGIAERVARMPWRAFALVPQPGLHFWNSNLLDPWPLLQAAAGAAVLAGAVALLWWRPAALATFTVGALGMLAFGYVKFVGSLRHDGHWWLLFAAALWLGGGAAAGGLGGWRRAAFYAALVVHVAVGIYASAMDLAHPFSNGGSAASLIRAGGLDRLPLLAYREPPAASVTLHLGRAMFMPSRGQFAKYPDWGPEQRDLELDALRCIARSFAAAERSDVALVMNRELPAWAEIVDAGATGGALQSTEDYHLYRLLAARLMETATDAGCPSP